MDTNCEHVWHGHGEAEQICFECDATRPKPMTQEEVENWILLQTQKGERWFEMRFVDETLNQDPTAHALMQSISDVVYAGTVSMVLEESIANQEAPLKIVE